MRNYLSISLFTSLCLFVCFACRQCSTKQLLMLFGDSSLLVLFSFISTNLLLQTFFNSSKKKKIVICEIFYHKLNSSLNLPDVLYSDTFPFLPVLLTFFICLSHLSSTPALSHLSVSLSHAEQRH